MRYRFKSLKPLKYQLKSTVLYSSVYWKASTDLVAIVLSFSLVASSIDLMSFLFSVEFSSSKASILDVNDVTLAS